jgi:hypothetical protein
LPCNGLGFDFLPHLRELLLFLLLLALH